MNFKDIIFSNIYKNIPSFGLDISDFSIKIAQLKKKRKGFELKSANRFSLPEGIIQEGEIKNDKKLIEMLKKAIIEAKGEKIRSKYAICSLPEQHAFVKVIKFPKMGINEIKEAIKWEAEANIPFSLDEVYFSWQIISLQERSDHTDVLINAVPRKLADKYLEVLRAAEIEPIVFEIESTAIVRSLIKEGIAVKPVLIIDLGFNRTSFVIFSVNGIGFTNSTSVVSNRQMFEDIAQKLNIDFKKAQSLKFKVGIDGEDEDKNVFNALIPSLTKLSEKIKECINFHREYGEKERGCSGINEIILCGGGANLRGLAEYLSARTKIPVSLGNPWVNILPDKKGKINLGKIPIIPYEESLAYATVLGLALRGANLSD
jgi:type IV pilus assembly protein PilM